MGGKNSASFFQQTMQEVLGDLVYVSTLIYIDDVLVYAEDFPYDATHITKKKIESVFLSILGLEIKLLCCLVKENS